MRDERLHPSPWQAHYVHLRALRASLRSALASWRAQQDGSSSPTVVDLGCGDRPYQPLFGHTAKYVGIDHRAGPAVDVVADLEALPLEDADFDIAMCTQAIQYVRDPRRAIAEMARILRPGGLALVSTHGVASSVTERWRWTQRGLQELFDESGEWESVRVIPHGGSASAIAYLTGTQLEGAARAGGALWAVAPVVVLLNLGAWWIDRLYRRLAPMRPPDLSPSYLVVAVRCAESPAG